MVYCGVPSKGCGSCRAKRTKCDQAVPSCGQCRRARRVCLGYRDEKSLTFRDQTRTVVSKAQAAKARSSKVTPGTDLPEEFNPSKDASGALVSIAQVSAYTQDIPRNPHAPIEEQGSFYFFHHFVRKDVNSPIAYNEYIPKIYNLTSSYSELPAIIQAIGMAGIANLQSSSEPMMIARRKHTACLRALNSSLQDPKTATSDATFMTVMLLSLYETITGFSPQSLKSWVNHINGATAIMRLRGKASLQTVVGRHLFSLLRIQIVVDCIQRRALIPPEIIEWSEYVIEMETNIDYRHEQETFPIITRLCTLRGLIEKERNNDPAVLVIAKGIDADLIEWADKSPSCFKYTRVFSNDAENVLSGYYHVYPKVWVVGTWNLYRSARILAHEVIERWLSRNFAVDFAQLQRSEAVLSMMSADICASVPCVFGQIDANGLQIGSSRFARAGTGTWILWPLYLAATMNRAMPTTRSWVINQLDRMGRTMGIQQAISLAAVLRTKKEITAWDSLGSRVDEEVDDW
ncbi:hypothetical protein N7G274_004523 [Stereocaulon virgatum]|uniref:Zn(2)-C6 fungal-type domain-containing protein n=1 Tax=Stereocaulon virgatum TaxID=373712 RepID=A0ABR4AA50_9LECA